MLRISARASRTTYRRTPRSNQRRGGSSGIRSTSQASPLDRICSIQSLTRYISTAEKRAPRFLMVIAFAILCLLRQPGRPHIGFLFVRSWICFTLPSDPASRQRPCASLVLRHHQAGQGTFPPDLLNMPGTQRKRAVTRPSYVIHHNAPHC